MSQTHTQTLHRTVVNPARNHDYLYDPNYTLSSEKDHARNAYKSHTNVDRVKRVPEFRQMFSALPHYPRFHLRLDNTDPVPRFINRRWRGYADQNREALVRYTTFNYDPSVQVPSVKYEDAKVTGQNRYKYFRRPIIPFLQQVPPEVLLRPTTVDPLAPPGEALQRPPTPATQTIAIQTDYRDSEAQTDPYTPEYVVRPGSAPELLTLATLTYNHGLPAGLAEVEMIERARAKRAWEKTLPPLSDVSQMEKRKKMMDDMETKEWLLREQEIEKLQEERLEVLKKLLVQREIKQQELNDQRLDKLWSKKQKIKEKKIHKIRKEHLRTIRRLTRKCENVEGKLERRDIVNEYGKFGSQVHAPLTRIGVFLDRGSEQYVVRSRYLNTFQGLLELEASLPDFVTQPRVRAPKKPVMTVNGYVKKKYRLTKQLEDMHYAIKESKKKGEEPPKPLRFLHKVEKPIPRPPTPKVEVPVEKLEEEELAAIFLQKVIRGRAIQNMMFEGKEKRLELINEVRSTHALQKAEQQIKKAVKQNVVNLQRQRRLYQHKESYVNEVLSHIEGETIGDMLDFLSKELIRLQEERRIHAISMLAERRRRLREAEESGRRQVEERRRREEDEIFKQLMKIHQNTVDTYLEDIIMTSVDKTADEQAREEIRKYADTINDVAYEMEDRRTLLQSEEIVSELVHCFLLPEVLKNNSREKIKQDQKKHLLAAHRIIHASTEPVIAEQDLLWKKRGWESGSTPPPQSSVLPEVSEPKIESKSSEKSPRARSPKSPEAVGALGKLLDADRVSAQEDFPTSDQTSLDQAQVKESLIEMHEHEPSTADATLIDEVNNVTSDQAKVTIGHDELTTDQEKVTSGQDDVAYKLTADEDVAHDQEDPEVLETSVAPDSMSPAAHDSSAKQSSPTYIDTAPLDSDVLSQEETKEPELSASSPKSATPKTPPAAPEEMKEKRPMSSRSGHDEPSDLKDKDDPDLLKAEKLESGSPKSDLTTPPQFLSTEKAAPKSISGSPSPPPLDGAPDQPPADDSKSDD